MKYSVFLSGILSMWVPLQLSASCVSEVGGGYNNRTFGRQVKLVNRCGASMKVNYKCSNGKTGMAYLNKCGKAWFVCSYNNGYRWVANVSYGNPNLTCINR